MAESDDVLISRGVAGEEEALVALLEQHGPAVRRSLAGKIAVRWQSVLSVDDVMQETYSDAFLSISRFRPQGDGSFLRWLTTLARNNLRDAVKELGRAKKGGGTLQVEARSPDGSHLDFYQHLAGSTATPGGKAALAEAKRALSEAFQHMPEVYRLVVSLYDLAGCSPEDAAQACGCSVGAMYMRRARAHEMLRSLLGTESRF